MFRGCLLSPLRRFRRFLVWVAGSFSWPCRPGRSGAGSGAGRRLRVAVVGLSLRPPRRDPHRSLRSPPPWPPLLACGRCRARSRDSPPVGPAARAAVPPVVGGVRGRPPPWPARHCPCRLREAVRFVRSCVRPLPRVPAVVAGPRARAPVRCAPVALPVCAVPAVRNRRPGAGCQQPCDTVPARVTQSVPAIVGQCVPVMFTQCVPG